MNAATRQPLEPRHLACHVGVFHFRAPALPAQSLGGNVQGNQFEICGASHGDITMRDLISAQMDGVYFPVTVREFAADVTYRDLGEGEFEVGGITVTTMLLRHPGNCLGFRLRHAGRSICYVTDNELYNPDSEFYSDEYVERLAEFARETDALITDCCYTDEAYARLEPAAGEVTREARQEEDTVPPLRIPVAEDNPVNQQVALGLLTRRGHRVDVVGNGRAAVEAVSARRYDVVLMDVHMSEMDGIEAAREIRQLPGDKGRLPIIALSASAMKEDTDQCLAAGMVAHLPKPIDPLALAAVLARCAHADCASTAPAESAATGVEQGYVQLLLESLGAAKVGELIGELRRQAQPQRDRLLQARASSDLAEMRAAAHALTGMTANLGLTAVAELTAAIEEACRQGRGGEAGSLCDRLPTSLEHALAELEALLHPGRSPVP